MNTPINEMGHLEMANETQGTQSDLTTQQTESTEQKPRVVRERRKKRERKEQHQNALGIEEVEAWAEAVDGKAILDELRETTRRYAVLPKWAAETLALWTLHTYAFQLRNVSTYIGIASPEKRCGKTTLLSVLSELVNRPLVASNISPPALFRAIEEAQPTLLIDEGDTFLQGNDELRGILNSGYTRKTAYVVRVANQIKNYEFKMQNGDEDGERRDSDGSGLGNASATHGLRRFSCWCPKVIAAIGRLPETLMDRSIVITMQRKTVAEQCERLRNLDGRELRRKCVRFVNDHAEELELMRPAVPQELNDRAADIWEPLLVIADLAGGEWPKLAREAAISLSAQGQSNDTIGSLLLDIFLCFTELEAERMFSRDIVARINTFSDRSWQEALKGKLADEAWLAQQLRPYGVRPKTIWIGERAAKGYLGEDLGQLYPRYISAADIEALQAQVRPVKEERPKAEGELRG